MTDCFPCPVVIDGTSPTVTTGLLDLINNGDLGEADDNGSLTAMMDINPADGNISESELADFLSTL
jgi:hypothetical protein